jgi:Lrp/AsnC family transcriptional regulator for asnA, asnC and gidA
MPDLMGAKRTMYDKLDLKLIGELEEVGLQTQAELGRKLGASESTIRRREHRLQESRAVRLGGIPNLAVLGYDLVATLGLNVNFERRPDILALLLEDPDVRYVASCTGRYELLVCFAGRSRECLSEFQERLTATPGMLQIETFVNLKVYKNRPWLMDCNGVQV